jgi:hypothetical protein
MIGRLFPACSHQHTRAFDSEMNLTIAKTQLLLLRVCAAAMTTTLIHRSPIHRKWVKAMELMDAEQHGKILHLGTEAVA